MASTVDWIINTALYSISLLVFIGNQRLIADEYLEETQTNSQRAVYGLSLKFQNFVTTGFSLIVIDYNHSISARSVMLYYQVLYLLSTD